MIHNFDRAALAATVRNLQGISTEDKNALIKLINDLKYGLVWENKPENVEERLRDEIPVLREVKERAIISSDTEAPNHTIIEGDNYQALTTLSYTHEGKIDVIYIDPPYNTGNRDFVYNDCYVDAEDEYRHSKWLSFMNKRLRIAKRLLSDRGFIFISIDDNEQAQLKLLCDEVFGSKNFITCFPWHSRQSLQNDTDISINHEYLICFAKKRRESDRRLKPSNASTWYRDNDFVFYPMKIDNDKYSNPDNDSRGPWKADPFDAPHVRPNLTYPILNPNTGEQHLPPQGRHWRISYEKYISALADNRILFGKNGKGRPQLKVFLYEQEQYGSISNSWLEAEKYGTATHGSKELQDIFGGDKVFSSPKPTSLIREILRLVSISEKPICILDFFAGSGTTLHATMQLNAEDGGHRRCILVTNNENNICEEVTYERNKRVINGYTTPKGERFEGLYDNNLRYYKTDFLSRDRNMKNMRQLVNSSTDLLCIKEDLYSELKTFGRWKIPAQIARYFGDGRKHMLIVYDERLVGQLPKMINEIDFGKERLKIYIFSPSRYAFDDDFYEVQDKVQLVALPAAIYDA
jgi:adenine-specific DNA-methyltransferase